MPNPTNASQATKLSSSNKSPAERKPQPKLEWTRPVRPPLKSGMLQNRKLDLNKAPQRSANKRP